jgi:hypothetical protein
MSEDTWSSGVSQIILHGPPSVAETIAWTYASKSGLECISSAEWPRPPRTDFFRQLDIGLSLDTGGRKLFGTVRLQGLPGDRHRR